ncbi:hypothetical protein ACH5RR_022270 [Cinchona calisaya]|uniref:Uncharacterized protein n=1 Tax=Cinchona calisaya TaxID=153742 RepID=A0ABD2Z7C4_9GENT
MKKQKPALHGYRSLSDSSNRSYHFLLGGGEQSNEGSSHRRTRSEFHQPQCFDNFLEQHSSGAGTRLDFISNAQNFNRANSILSPSTTNLSGQLNSTSTMASYQVSTGIKS